MADRMNGRVIPVLGGDTQPPKPIEKLPPGTFVIQILRTGAPLQQPERVLYLPIASEAFGIFPDRDRASDVKALLEGALRQLKQVHRSL